MAPRETCVLAEYRLEPNRLAAIRTRTLMLVGSETQPRYRRLSEQINVAPR